MNETAIYTLEDLKEKLRISIRTLRQYIRKGELKASKIGKAYYVTEPNFLTFVESRRVDTDKKITFDMG